MKRLMISIEQHLRRAGTSTLSEIARALEQEPDIIERALETMPNIENRGEYYALTD